jgi:glycosyltransferase involved in cell wall biosynthesis
MVVYSFYETDNRVRRYAESLVKRGDQVDAFALQREGQPSVETISGVRVFRIQKRVIDEGGPSSYLIKLLLFFVRSAWILTWRHLRTRYDLIHVHSVPDFEVFATIIPRLMGARVILDIHDIVPEFYASKFKVSERSLVFRLLLWIEAVSIAYSNHVIISNHLWYEKITQRSVTPDKCTAIINYPDPSIFSRHSSKHATTSEFLMCYPGTLNWHQGVDLAIHAMALLRDKAPNLRFLIIGKGPDQNKLEVLVKLLGLESCVSIVGLVPIEKVAEIMARVDLGVVPKRKDSFGNEAFSTKIMEFMAMGVPVVVSNTRIDQYYFNDSLVQFFESEDAEDLAAKILALVQDAAKRDALVAHGTSFIQKNNWDVKKQEYLNLVDGLVRRSRPLAPSVESPVAPGKQYRTIPEEYEPAANTRHGVSGTGPELNVQSSSPLGSPSDNIARLLRDRYRCPDDLGHFVVDGDLSRDSGYFRFGSHAICYGQCSSSVPATLATSTLHDASEDVVLNGSVHLPFDPAQVVDNLRCERYHVTPDGSKAFPGVNILRGMYYLARPMLGVSVRKHLQRWYFSGWEKIAFPRWPVDRTVEDIIEQLLVLSMKARKVERVPFIWFWPEGARSCTMMTHDVETSDGRDFCSQLMDLNDSFGIKSSFQIVPEKRYAVSQAFLESIHNRDFEVNVHDLNHDGRLMCDRQEFTRRAERINRYGRQFGALGFRSAVMYRNSDWYDALDFSYDMSIPNVASLDPQRGGCCTVLPFFINKVLELPLTTTQDYSLLNILNHYSTRLWKEQISLIRRKYGLISFIIHPDYNIDLAARSVYIELLQHLSEMRSKGETWIGLPRDVAAWWRQRSEMSLVNVGTSWRIEGTGSERARLAYAVIDRAGALTYELASEGVEKEVTAVQAGQSH